MVVMLKSFICLGLSVSVAWVQMQPALGWGLHYLVTDRSLEKISLPESIPVKPIEIFLTDQALGLKDLFNEYAFWAKSHHSNRFKEIPFDPKKPNLLTFLKSARLNPRTQFFQVNRVMPNEPLTGKEITLAALSPYEKKEKHFTFNFRDVSGEKVSARSILRTFSDEPDWWFDGDLFQIPEYGYGKKPYGQEGGSSGAPFHMLFRHENLLVRTFAPELTEGMTDERVELFGRLAKLAFKSGHPYWGYRFSAWSIHYIQDLCQPYHSSAVPSASLLYYLRFVLSFDKEKFKADTTQLVANRHYLYEDFAKLILQDSYLSPDARSMRLSQALRQDQTLQTTSLQELVSEVGNRAFSQGARLDRSIIEAYGPHMTEDPKYSMQDDLLYDAAQSLKHLKENLSRSLVEETENNFFATGGATRNLLRQLTQ